MLLYLFVLVVGDGFVLVLMDLNNILVAMLGCVVKFMVIEGDQVRQGDFFFILDVMKMEYVIYVLVVGLVWVVLV